MKFSISGPTALALLSALTLSSAFSFTFESYLPDEPNCCRVHFDAVGKCKGNSASTCLTGPNEAHPDNLCVPNREDITYISGEVGVFNGGNDDTCETATLSVDWSTGEISFQQPDADGEEVYYTSCIASGFDDNDGCNI